MRFAVAVIALLAAFPALAQADAGRQAEVAARGAEVMPFSLDATTHVFSKTRDGGTQRVVARDAGDAAQVRLVRAHLQQIRRQFLQGDVSAPAHIHGEGMPGLEALHAAGPGRFRIDYRDVAGGGELRYRSNDPKRVAALHRWFDAQLADHGKDAMEGHHHRGH